MIRRLFVALSLTGVAVATVLVLRRSGGPEALFVLSAGNHLAALGAMSLEVVMRGARFVILGAAMGVSVPLLIATMAQLAGDGGGAVTPSRSGSDPAKALILVRHGVRGGHIGALLVGEVVAEAVLLPVCALVLILSLESVSLTAMGATLTWSVAALTLVGVAVWLAPTRDSTAPRLLQRFGVTGPRWERLVTIAAAPRPSRAGRFRFRIRQPGGIGRLAVLSAVWRAADPRSRGRRRDRGRFRLLGRRTLASRKARGTALLVALLHVPPLRPGRLARDHHPASPEDAQMKHLIIAAVATCALAAGWACTGEAGNG
ncbi:MAG: hypothetical protein F4187_02935, partial [Gemmatimonadetes bacterium]|nr:hypothetical protein [Gemmatimonadota bacterium]